MISRLLAVMVLLLTLLVQTNAATPTPTVKLRSTREEVVKALGEPQGTLKQGTVTVLVYPKGDIRIQNDRVIKVAEAYQDAAEEDEFTIPGATTNAPTTNAPATNAASAMAAPETATKSNALPSWLGIFGKLRGTNTTGQAGQAKPKPIFTWLGLGVIVLGSLATLAGNIWLLVKAFTEHIGWGLACLFVPMVILVFVAMHWSDSWKPFLLSLGGSIAVVGGVVLMMLGAAG